MLKLCRNKLQFLQFLLLLVSFYLPLLTIEKKACTRIGYDGALIDRQTTTYIFFKTTKTNLNEKKNFL